MHYIIEFAFNSRCILSIKIPNDIDLNQTTPLGRGMQITRGGIKQLLKKVGEKLRSQIVICKYRNLISAAFFGLIQGCICPGEQ